MKACTYKYTRHTSTYARGRWCRRRWWWWDKTAAAVNNGRRRERKEDKKNKNKKEHINMSSIRSQAHTVRVSSLLSGYHRQPCAFNAVILRQTQDHYIVRKERAIPAVSSAPPSPPPPSPLKIRGWERQGPWRQSSTTIARTVVCTSNTSTVELGQSGQVGRLRSFSDGPRLRPTKRNLGSATKRRLVLYPAFLIYYVGYFSRKGQSSCALRRCTAVH